MALVWQAIAGLLATCASAAAPQINSQAPGYYRMRLGDFEITALLDGTHPFPDAEVLTEPGKNGSRVKLFDADQSKATALLNAAFLSVPTEGTINAYLVNTGRQLVLVDSGAGSLYGPCCGHLLANLRAAGYGPEQIDAVLLTHLHADHVGGIAPNGLAAFPNAIIYASQSEADYWLHDLHKTDAPPLLKPMFERARASLQPYIASGRFRTLVDSREVFPGITAIPSPGHTPGHTLYDVESRGQRMLIWGDTVHVASIQFPDPSVTVEYDSNPSRAEASRRKIMEEASRARYWVAAAHIAFPGIGHVTQHDRTFTWIPTDFTTRLGPQSPP